MISFQDHNTIDVKNVLEQGGVIAQAYPDFEMRQPQLDMALAVNKAFDEGFHLVAEAGTGVGKSFAYLVNAIKAAHEKRGRVLISTYTINLQEQLINKDIPFLADILDCNFDACLAKGRNNYLCLRRLSYALRKQQGLFDNVGDELQKMSQWSTTTEDGSLSDLSFSPSPAAWEMAKSEHGNCKGRKCPHFKECFYWRARRQLETANIIVANHSLLFSDLVLKEQGVGILPDYQFVVVDEAHNAEHVAEDHFGINITNFSIRFILNSLYNNRGGKGLLNYTNDPEAINLVEDCDQAAKVFFAQVQAWYAHAGKETNGTPEPGFVDDNISEPLKNLRLTLSKLAKGTDDDDDQLEYSRNIDRIKGLEVDLKNFLTQPDKENIYWIEVSNSKRIALRSAPLNVGPHIKRCLFDEYKTVVATSATLTCGHGSEKSGFEFFTNRIGLEDFQAVKLGSPFDYENQVTMYIEADLPEPNDANFTANAAEAIKKYLTKTDGKAFVLFTSYTMLNAMSKELEDWLRENDIELLCQGQTRDRSALLESFKADERSVLFGTDSFWQGVDVPGKTLSNVIIVKLPFAVPFHPLIQGRIAQIKEQGGNPFFDYQLPVAIIKFKQGFGRLIRSKSDHGIVVILDSRVVRKRYGKRFIDAVPKCKVEIVHEEF